MFKKLALMFLGFVGLFTQVVQADTHTVLTAYTTHYEPYNFRDGKGKAAGYTVEIVNALSERLQEKGVAVHLEFLPWARAFRQATENKNSLIFSIARTRDRESLFYWIGRMLPMPVYLVKHKSRTDIIVNDAEKSKMFTVAGVMGSAPTLCVEKLGYKVHYSTTHHAYHLEMLAKGRVDLMAMDFPSFGALARETGINQADYEPVLFLDECSYDLYLGMGKNSDPGMVQKVMSAWQTIDKKGAVNRVRQSFENKYKPFH